MDTTGLKFNVVMNDGDPSSVTAFQRGKIYVATIGHPNFQRILSVFRDGQTWDGPIEELFDVGQAIVAKFLRVTERVAIANCTILFDGGSCCGCAGSADATQRRTRQDAALADVREWFTGLQVAGGTTVCSGCCRAPRTAADSRSGARYSRGSASSTESR